ncbi:MAG TPA: M20 family metallopeptidase [Acidimicrobiales bacterium]
MPDRQAAGRLAYLRGRRTVMVEALAALVEAESPSDDPAGLAACADVISDLVRARLGSPPAGGPHLLWSGGGRVKVLLLGHYDTVWPLGTTARWPFALEGDRATGPGSFDMKAGIVQMIEALATLGSTEGVALLLTADEELGSQTSRALVEDTARGARAALVCEPSLGGRLKSARKGTGMYTVRVHGRAAHAGLEPEKGANALVGLGEVVLAAARLGDAARGTTVVPTVASAGTATNVVPAEATVELDVRIAEAEEAARVDADVRALRSTVGGTTVTVDGGPNRPPMPASASAELLALAEECAADLGFGPLGAVTVGGASDANFTAAVGTPTLDGLGAVGDGLHAEGEHVIVPTMAERAALLAALIERLT